MGIEIFCIGSPKIYVYDIQLQEIATEMPKIAIEMLKIAIEMLKIGRISLKFSLVVWCG